MLKTATCIHLAIFTIKHSEAARYTYNFTKLQMYFEMNSIGLACILIVNIANALVQENSICPTWYEYKTSTGQCECTDNLSGGLLCKDPGKVYLRIDYCMTLDNHTNLLTAGSCHRGHYNSRDMIRGIYGLLPNDSTLLRESQCEPNNREGLLCSKCIDGYGVAVTSLTPKCVKCTLSVLPAALLYVLIELLPLTIFFVAIVIFHINITSGPLSGYFIYCQTYAAVTNQHFELYSSILNNSSSFTKGLLYISYALSSLWALCSFNILPPLCISQKISLKDAITLKYIRVVYPLVLVAFTYFLIELHAYNFKPVVYLWKPFSACFRRLNLNITANDSIIHAYATLFLLSFAVLNFIAFMLMNRTDLTMENNKPVDHRLVVDPTIVGYSSTHAPYVVVTFGILLCVGIFPAILLCLYPFGIFRNALESIIGQRSRIALNIFVETLLSCYKDGLQGTRDYRSTLGIMLLVTIGLVLYNAHDTGHWALSAYVIAGCILLVTAITIAYVQPLKAPLANLSLCFHAGLAGILCIYLIVWMGSDVIVDVHTIADTFAALNFIPHLLITLWIVYKALSQIQQFRSLVIRGISLFRRIGQHMLPQRLINLRSYSSLQ